MNVFTGIGRIGRDAVTRFTQGGKPVTSWALAIDVGYGENKQTLWLDCSAWGERFQKVGEFIKKGDRLGVSGEVGTREHDGKTYVTLNVREVTLLAPKREGGDQQRPTRSAPAPTPSSTPSGPGGSLDDDEIPFAPRGKHSHFI